MKKFVCSLCHKGIIGGALYLDENAVTYKTNKLAVDKAHKNLLLPIEEIAELTWRWVVFPIATFYMKDGVKHQIIVFNKRRFEKCFEEYCAQ